MGQWMSQEDASVLGEAEVGSTRKVFALSVGGRPLCRRCFKLLIEDIDDRFVVDEAASVEDIRAYQADGRRLDLLLLGLVSHRDDNYALLSEIAREFPDIPLVVHSEIEDPEYARRALLSGVRAYVPASLGADAVADALRLVTRGGVYFPIGVLDHQMGRADAGSDATDEGRALLAKLTPRQREIFQLLGQGMSNSDIADALGLRDGTVRLHIHKVLRALGVRSRTQAALIAQRSLSTA